MGEWVPTYIDVISYVYSGRVAGYIRKPYAAGNARFTAYIYDHTWHIGEDAHYFSTVEEAKAFVETTAALVLGD